MIHLIAYLDTGASDCLFEWKYGELLNLNIEAGEPKTFDHIVAIEVLGLQVESMVYFFADEEINKIYSDEPVGWTGFASALLNTIASLTWHRTTSNLNCRNNRQTSPMHGQPPHTKG